MEQKYEKNSYKEAFYGFQERGLYLDEPKKTFVHNQKSDCHCLKHPDNKMKYAWCYVKMGRFSCKECKKETPYIARTDEEKIQDLLDNSINTDFEYESLLSDKGNPLLLVYRYLAYLVRSEKDKTEQFIKNTIGKYIDEITIPKCDIEEDMEDE